MRTITYGEARAEALRTAMGENPHLVAFGDLRGPYDPPNGIVEAFGDRVFQPPISETAFIGAAAGLAMTGWPAFCDTHTASFMFTAFDQVVNEAPNVFYMSGGRVRVPMVMRIVAGVRGGGGAQHSHSPERWLMSVPGLKVFKPSTPGDVKGLFLAALDDPNPVVFVDHVKLGGLRGEVPEEAYRIPLGRAEVRRTGSDVTLAAAGLMVHRCMEAADSLAAEGIGAEVLDLRSLKPLDRDGLLRSVARTRRLVVVDESPATAGLAAELAALVAEEDPGLLRSPVRRVCMPDAPVAYSRPLEDSMVPTAAAAAAAARELMA
jgi:pyruvate/2-oxoglutarate/acetoin dehydrogenase E1 component